jgi:hypothetical protein
MKLLRAPIKKINTASQHPADHTVITSKRDSSYRTTIMSKPDQAPDTAGRSR